MSFTKKEREQYNSYRERVGKDYGIGKNEYNALRRVSHKLHEHSEDYASGRKDWRWKQDSRGSKEYGEKEYKHDVNRAFAKAEALRRKKKLKVHFYHQGDPRGTSLYVSKERMSDSDYPQKGRPIY